ncbi:hypothetical protein [Sphingomonas sp. CFBP 13720]|uniref:hypothetical protein n=1 Tax=Sphingomonas sp. CFBP 13720 TaxID=2775302 RepID=UPI0017834F57|nr:hypothetical protein [Sphingomonas sp. CFBP 13720]MBD8677086.1 hypothetical protein [Sphingomonas sp. CFBP 13720]
MRRSMMAMTVMIAGLASAQSIDRILAAAAQRDAADGCKPQSDDAILVCGDRDRGDRYRLPLPVERDPDEAGAVAGEPARTSVESPYLNGCGVFAGQRRCSKREAAAYGYGGGRDPVTLVGRLVTKLVDPDAEIATSE